MRKDHDYCPWRSAYVRVQGFMEGARDCHKPLDPEYILLEKVLAYQRDTGPKFEGANVVVFNDATCPASEDGK